MMKGNPDFLSMGEELLRDSFPKLDLPFRQPDLELLGIVVNSTQDTKPLHVEET